MGNFNRGYRSDSGRSFGNRDRKALQMYDAVCSSCGRECQLPFRPTGERPVYCKDCFAKNGAGDSNKSYGKPIENRQLSPSKEQLESINYKLDKIIKLLTSNVDKLPEVVKEEAVSTIEAVSEEQPVVIEKKKRAKKSLKKEETTL